MIKYCITILLVINMYYCNAQTINDYIITKGYDFTITKLTDKAVLHYKRKSISTADTQIIFYNNYQLDLPLEIKWWMQLGENLTILYENDQLISIDPGRKNDLTQGKITKWKMKKYKRKKRHIPENDPIDILGEGLIQTFESDCELLFTNNGYIKSLNKKITVNEVYHFSNGVANILVINNGELSKFIKNNINSFRFKN